MRSETPQRVLPRAEHAISLSLVAGIILLASARMTHGTAQSVRYVPTVDSPLQVNGAEAMPPGSLFVPLLADPKRPEFLATLLRAESRVRETSVAAVAFGQELGLVRWGTVERGIQLGLSGGVFSQFDLGTKSFDLLNTDYVIGVPISFRRGSLSARARIYHQSSHLGDELLIREAPERVNLSFESIEALASADIGRARVYGGGEWIIRREPDAFQRGALHFGGEFRQSSTLFRVGSLGGGRIVVGIDGRAWEQHGWSWAGSVRGGVELGPWDDTGSSERSASHSRTWALLVELYDGPSPYGQFFTQSVRFVGLGVHVNP